MNAVKYHKKQCLPFRLSFHKTCMLTRFDLITEVITLYTSHCSHRFLCSLPLDTNVPRRPDISKPCPHNLDSSTSLVSAV